MCRVGTKKRPTSMPHVPPLARQKGLSIVYSPEKFQKLGKSCHGEIRPIIRVFPFDLCRPKSLDLPYV